MSKKDKDRESKPQIDLSGFSDKDINKLYVSAQKGVRRQGYDGSNDVTVDYDPMASDAIKASQAVMSDWTKGNWKDVKEAADKVGMWSNEDTIHKMRGAVAKEYHKRSDARLSDMDSRIDANTNREFPEAKAAPEEKEDGKTPPLIEPIKDSELVKKTGESIFGKSEPTQERVKAKSKAQSYSGAKIDYSFNAGGGGTANPPTSANSGGTDRVDIYGNVTPEAAAQGHADNLLSKYKYGISQAQRPAS